MIDAIETGGDPAILVERLNALERRRRELEASLPAKSDTAAVSLHPQAAESYRRKVAEIHEALARGEDASLDAVASVRNLIREIRISPTAQGSPVIIEVYGEIAAVLDGGTLGEHGDCKNGCGGRI